MKKTKIIISILLAIVMCLPLVSCGDTKINVTVKVCSDEYGVMSEGTVELSAKEATVLKAMSDYCEANEFKHVYNDAGDSIKNIGEFKEKEANRFSYFWMFTVNDKEVSGRASENYLADGDVVTYNYTSMPMGDYVTVKFVAEDEKFCEATVVFDSGDTVIDAAVDALNIKELENAVSEDGLTLELADEYQAKVTPAYDEAWSFTVNGKAVKTAAGETALSNEDVIEFTFVRTTKNVEE